MKVILLTDIRGLGKRTEVKNVSDGYAKNFLIPKNLAKIAVDSEIKKLEALKIKAEKEYLVITEKIKQIISQIKSKKFYFSPKVGKNMEVFSSVTKTDIEEMLIKELPEELKDKIKMKVDLTKPIRNLGQHEIEVDFGNNIKTKITIDVNK
ncbi:50S ribosomal protein L9 [Candidatus Wolfebacteria bacterium]|nr:50S ribosomal protein L9 [Candidatus Wolfebacteria bacterium]